MPRWRPRSCGVNTSMIVLSHRRILYCPDGGMADAHASGACILTDVEVRVLFWAPFDSQFVCELLAHGKPLGIIKSGGEPFGSPSGLIESQLVFNDLTTDF